MNRKEVLFLDSNPLFWYHRAVNALHSDNRQGMNGYLYQAMVHHYNEGVVFEVSVFKKTPVSLQEEQKREKAGCVFYYDCDDRGSSDHWSCFGSLGVAQDSYWLSTIDGRPRSFQKKRPLWITAVPFWVIDILRKEMPHDD